MSETSFTNLQAELISAQKFDNICGFIGSMIAISTAMYALRKEAMNDESMSCIPYTKIPLVFFPFSILAAYIGDISGRFVVPFVPFVLPLSVPGLILSYFMTKK